MKVFARIGRNQIRNLLNLVRGRPITMSSMGSMTLDIDDVELAKKWLRNRSAWDDCKLVQEYEAEFARWNGSQFAFAFMSGRVALSACIYALDLNPGDEVILPGYTCVVVPNAFRYAEVVPVFADIELDTYGLDAKEVEKKITPNTRAIMLHHLYGLVCRDYEAIVNLAEKFNLRVIEDCAHSAGAIYKGRKVGNRGDVAFYSSEQSKVLNTIQGGLAVTNSPKVAKQLEAYYEQAQLPNREWMAKQLQNIILNYYQYKDRYRWWRADIAELLFGRYRLISTSPEEELGIRPANYGRRMSAPIAAIGLNQLKKIEYYNDRRRETAKQWDTWCENKAYKKPVVIEGSVPVFLRYPVMVEEEKKRNISWARSEIGVNLGVWFISNIHPVQIHIEDCPNADMAVKKCINFPTLLK